MQTTGYILDENNNTILILVRQAKCSRYLKIRKSGKKGVHFIDEEIYFKKNITKLKNLKAGFTVEC